VFGANQQQIILQTTISLVGKTQLQWTNQATNLFPTTTRFERRAAYWKTVAFQAKLSND